MALTYTTYFKGQADAVSPTITSDTLTAATGDAIDVVVVYGDNVQATAWTISNTNTAISWGSPVQQTNTASNCKVMRWRGTAGATPPGTISVQSTAGDDVSATKVMFVVVSTGQHATTPWPAGNEFSGVGGTDVAQAITPTSAGSCLWLVAGDWNATNTFAAATNCTLAASVYHEASQQTVAAVRPTTQPRSDASSFTIGETDTGGKVAWIAWEVQAAASAAATKQLTTLGVG